MPAFHKHTIHDCLRTDLALIPFPLLEKPILQLVNLILQDLHDFRVRRLVKEHGFVIHIVEGVPASLLPQAIQDFEAGNGEFKEIVFPSPIIPTK